MVSEKVVDLVKAVHEKSAYDVEKRFHEAISEKILEKLDSMKVAQAKKMVEKDHDDEEDDEEKEVSESIKSRVADFKAKMTNKTDEVLEHHFEIFVEKVLKLIDRAPTEMAEDLKSELRASMPKLSKAKSVTEFEKIAKGELSRIQNFAQRKYGKHLK